MKVNCRAIKTITIREYIKSMDDWDLLTFLSVYDEEIPQMEHYETLCSKCKPIGKMNEHTGNSMLLCEKNESGECPYGSAVRWWINQPVESSDFFRKYFLSEYDEQGNKIVCSSINDGTNVGGFLAKRIKTLRANAGESQQQLADMLDVKRETVKFWEIGARQIKATDLAKLALHFGVSVDYLLGLKTESE